MCVCVCVGYITIILLFTSKFSGFLGKKPRFSETIELSLNSCTGFCIA